MADYDLIIRNGTIVDGTGAKPFVADVAIAGGTIRAMGRIDVSATREIDATGKLVTPGFVDVHTHYDGQAIWSDRLNPSSSHGVTTVVVGNCGVGFAPCRPGDHDLLIKVMEGVEDIPGAVMAEGLKWDWETFPQYLDALEARPRDIDVAAYLPHSPLRVYVMGERGANREVATGEDLAKMRELAREAVDAGAIGFASSRVRIHRTADGDLIPSYDAEAIELREIAAGMAESDGGLIQAVPDIPMDGDFMKVISPLIDAARSTGQPLTFSFGTGNSGPQLWPEVMAMIEKANANGAQISAQVFPRPIGLVVGLNVTINPFCMMPSYAEVADLPLPRRVEALRNPELRARLLSEAPLEGHPLAAMGRNYEWTFPLEAVPNYEPDLSRSVASQAAARGVTPHEQMYDMLLENGGENLFFVALGNFSNGSLDSVGQLLQHDNVIVGLGDGGAHYGMICDSSYPTFMLAHWSRDRKGTRIPVETIVKMLAAETARVVGLGDRGILAPGYKADVNVIDHARLTLLGPDILHDLPAGGRRLDQRAEGYVATIVSGEIIAENGVPTAARPGRLVRGRQDAPAASAAA